jgi:hypothetical protein
MRKSVPRADKIEIHPLPQLGVKKKKKKKKANSHNIYAKDLVVQTTAGPVLAISVSMSPALLIQWLFSCCPLSL